MRQLFGEKERAGDACGIVADDLQPGDGGGHHGGRQAGGIDEAAGPVPEPVAHEFRARHVAAIGAHGLGERAHLHIHLHWGIKGKARAAA